MANNDLGSHRSRIHQQIFLNPVGIEATAAKIIMWASFIIGISLRLLPFEIIDGNPVPTVIFKGQPSIFQTFVICIMFAFTGSFCSLAIEENKFRSMCKLCRYFSMASMAAAFMVLVYALFLGDFIKWGFRGKQVLAE